MRPIKIGKVGDKVTLFNDIHDIDTEEHIIQEEYKDHRRARTVLISQIGGFCAYCEHSFQNPAILHLEHVQPKGLKEGEVLKYDDLKNRWINFLLGCQVCNGPSNKGEKDVDLEKIHLPHRNNTFLSLRYQEAGVVDVNPEIPQISRERAQALIDLVGLGKPNSESDLRCDMRRKAWDKAKKYRKDYEEGRTLLNHIIDYVKAAGDWSIWFTVFEGIDAVRVELLKFPGTATECFDQTNHYKPLPRNPGMEDPI